MPDFQISDVKQVHGPESRQTALLLTCGDWLSFLALPHESASCKSLNATRRRIACMPSLLPLSSPQLLEINQLSNT